VSSKGENFLNELDLLSREFPELSKAAIYQLWKCLQEEEDTDE
jgi:hypothetical protein